MRWCFSPKTVMGQCNSSLSRCVENCPVPPRIENRCPSLCSWKMLSIPAVYADCWHHFLLRASPRDGAVLSQCMVNVEHTRLTNSIYTDVKLGRNVLCPCSRELVILLSLQMLSVLLVQGCPLCCLLVFSFLVNSMRLSWYLIAIISGCFAAELVNNPTC